MPFKRGKVAFWEHQCIKRGWFVSLMREVHVIVVLFVRVSVVLTGEYELMLCLARKLVILPCVKVVVNERRGIRNARSGGETESDLNAI